MAGQILLTGITGYIARHIALQALEAGFAVRGSLRDPARGAEVAAAIRPALQDPGHLDQRLSFTALDLTKDDGWAGAMAGVDVLIHTASPFPIRQPEDPAELIGPAVDGTLRALRSARAAGVTRVVLTSSTAAITGSDLPPGDISYDETNWTDPDAPGITPYVRSKTLAEQAAWDFVSKEAPEMKLTVINPGFVLGAPLGRATGSSVQVIQRILQGKDPMVPDIGFGTVDVRDVAALHVLAAARPDTAGQRIMAVDRFLSFRDLALALKAAYPDRRIATRVAPHLLIRFLALFDREIRSILPGLGKTEKLDNARAMKLLGRGMYQAPKAAVDTAAHLIDTAVV